VSLYKVHESERMAGQAMAKNGRRGHANAVRTQTGTRMVNTMQNSGLTKISGSWRSIIGCMLVMTITVGAFNGGLGVFASGWINEFSLGSGEVMLIVVGISVASGLFSIFVGSIIDRFRPRHLLMTGIVLAATAQAIASFATSFPMLLLSLVPLSAAGFALCGPLIGQNLAVRSFEKPGFPIAIVVLGLSLGAILGPPIFARLMVNYGWESTLQMSALFTIIVGPLLVVGLVGKMPGLDPATDTAKGAAVYKLKSYGKILLDPTFIGAVLFLWPLMALMAGTFFHLVLFGIELGVPVTSAASILSLGAIAGLSGGVISGWITDRYSEKICLAGTLIVMAASQFLLAFVPGILTLGIAAVTLSLGNSMLFPLIPTIFSRRMPPRDFPRALSVFQAFLQCTVLGALILGFVHDLVGGYPEAYKALLPMLLIPLVGMLVLLMVRQKISINAAPAVAEN